MNHDEGQIPDFYTFAQPEPVQPAQDPWAAFSTTKKGKKKKKAKSYADDYFTPQAAQEEVPAPPLTPPHAPPEPGGFDGIDLNEDDFPPDRLVELDVNSERASSPLVNTYTDPAPTRKDDQHSSLPLASPPAAESPRPAPAKPVPLPSAPPIRHQTSYGSSHSYGSSAGYPHAAAPPHPRRESVPAQSSTRPHFVEPTAPPHMPQPHFYGLPDLGLDFGWKKHQQQNVGKTAGSHGYCCCFDSLADAGDAASTRKAKDALLVGSEGALEVFRVLPNKVEVVGRLEGLRGSVIGAKILPHVSVWDALQPWRPLVAVIVHGVADDAGESLGDLDHRRRSSVPESLRYQTTVEIYSLRTQEHLSTLFKSLPITVQRPNIGNASSLPDSVEQLCVTAQGRFIVIASGKSGEVFVFSNIADLADNEPQFRCIGKFWTSLQRPLENSSSRPPSSSESNPAAESRAGKTGVPLFSLNLRWLAIVPPPTASHVSVQGFPDLPESNNNPPGLASAVAPPQPPTNCEITVDTEDTWSRLTRQAAQGVVKYSQKGMDLGWQGWKEFTNPTPQPAQPSSRTSNKEREGMFPPTKAPPDDPRRMNKEPALVSVIDLEALLDAEATKAKYPPNPLASFALPDGCNFVSFSSNGLRMLTVSRKGEISTIWDLSRSCHGRLKVLDSQIEHSTTKGPSIKVIHRIARSSPAVVSDCTWSRDDDCLAILTTHGTVHLHEVPVRSRRKRKRRNTGTAPAPDKARATVSVSQGASPPSSSGGFLGSIRFGLQQMSTQVNSIRTKSSTSNFGIPTSFAGFRDATTSVGQAGGRVIAKGLSQGLSAAKGGASDYWHSDDNKIRHHDLQEAAPRSLQWVQRHGDLCLAVVHGGTVHLHPVHRTHRMKGDTTVSGLKHDRYGQKHFTLPSIRTRASLEANNAAAAAAAAAAATRTSPENRPHGFWSLRAAAHGNEAETRLGGARPPPPPPPPQTNEVETNPPYCPFHVDPRVDIFAFDARAEDAEEWISGRGISDFQVRGHGSGADSPWLFGEALPASTKMNTRDDLDYLHHDPDFDSDGNAELAEQVKSVLTIHPAAEEDGREEIRINTQRSQIRLGDWDDGASDAGQDDDDGAP